MVETLVVVGRLVGCEKRRRNKMDGSREESD
jgi:hypothetical protein